MARCTRRSQPARGGGGAPAGFGADRGRAADRARRAATVPLQRYRFPRAAGCQAWAPLKYAIPLYRFIWYAARLSPGSPGRQGPCTIASQKAHRIDIDLEPHPRLRFRRPREPAAQIARKIEAPRRLRQQPKPVPAAYHRNRGLGGAEHPHCLPRRRCTGKTPRKAFGGWTIGPGDDEAREPPERRIPGALARLDLGRVEGRAVAGNDRTHHRVLRLMGLEIAVAAAGFAAGAGRHLIQELKGPLGGARIAIVQA